MKIGIDIVENKRIKKLLDKNREAFLNKVFTELERSYIRKRGYKVETVAGLYSAKEALAKSVKLGLGRIGLQNIEISHGEYGEPIIKIDKDKASELNLSYSYDLSISHETNYSVAVVISY